MAVKRLNTQFKTRTELDNITPNYTYQMNVSAPAGEWKPAPWLPIEWKAEAIEDYFVISGGKVVSLTSDGYIVPAGYKDMAYGSEVVGATLITYLQRDVDMGVIDITTNVAVAAAKVVTLTQLASAILANGDVMESEVADADWNNGAAFDATSAADCRLVLDLYFSAPVGVCAYDVFVWAGDLYGAGLNLTNYQKQHLIQFFTDVEMIVPVHTAMDASGDPEPQTAASLEAGVITTWAAAGGDGEVFPDGEAAGAPLFVSSTSLATLSRYAGLIAAGDDIYAIALANSPVAMNTDRTPFTDSGTVLVRFRSGGIPSLTKAGDWWVDEEVGLIFINDGGAAGAASTFVLGETVIYYVYDATFTAGAHRYIHCNGPVKPGDYVTYDRKANFTPFTDTAAETYASGVHAFEQVVGRVLAVIKEPKGLLDRVRTAWEGSYFDKTAQMPGTATKGFTDLITLSDEYVANQVAIINVKVL